MLERHTADVHMCIPYYAVISGTRKAHKNSTAEISIFSWGVTCHYRLHLGDERVDRKICSAQCTEEFASWDMWTVCGFVGQEGSCKSRKSNEGSGGWWGCWRSCTPSPFLRKISCFLSLFSTSIISKKQSSLECVSDCMFARLFLEYLDMWPCLRAQTAHPEVRIGLVHCPGLDKVSWTEAVLSPRY